MITPTVRVCHRPVLVAEALQGLAVRPGGVYVDCTVGEGGHALAVLESATPNGRLLGLDADPWAIKTAQKRLGRYGSAVSLVHSNFDGLAQVAREHGFAPADGILFDLGLSSLQLDGGGRGFSFKAEDPLDMRFNPSQELTAGHIANTWPQAEITRVIATYGEEPRAMRIAQAIINHRPITTALSLARIVERAAGYRRGRTHPATRAFQALRIAVNGELVALKATLPQAVALLKHGGRLAVIAYHSLEDRIAKEFLRQESRDCLCPTTIPVCQCEHRATVRRITGKVIVPSLEEVRENPRSRSARMRVVQRL